MRALSTAAAAAAITAALSAGTAFAAQPQAGAYAGPTTQPESIPFAGRLKLTTVADGTGHRVAKVRARMKMDCQGDPARIETFTVAIPADKGRVSSSGRFSYTVSTTPTTGFTIKGRFVSATRARGTFGRSDAATGCYVGDVSWTAKLKS